MFDKIKDSYSTLGIVVMFFKNNLYLLDIHTKIFTDNVIECLVVACKSTRVGWKVGWNIPESSLCPAYPTIDATHPLVIY